MIKERKHVVAKKPWLVSYVLSEQLEDKLSEYENAGYYIDKYEMVPESSYWVVVGHYAV